MLYYIYRKEKYPTQEGRPNNKRLRLTYRQNGEKEIRTMKATLIKTIRERIAEMNQLYWDLTLCEAYLSEAKDTHNAEQVKLLNDDWDKMTHQFDVKTAVTDDLIRAYNLLGGAKVELAEHYTRQADRPLYYLTSYKVINLYGIGDSDATYLDMIRDGLRGAYRGIRKASLPFADSEKGGRITAYLEMLSLFYQKHSIWHDITFELTPDGRTARYSDALDRFMQI